MKDEWQPDPCLPGAQSQVRVIENHVDEQPADLIKGNNSIIP